MFAIERARLSLLGLATGDAFGETLFGEPGAIAARIAKRLIAIRRPWRWTDDTAMALSIVEVLARRGEIDPDDLAAAFARRWREEPDRGYGQGAYNLLSRVSAGASWRTEARRLFNGQGSMGNGAAMRAAPIGAYFAGDLERVVAETLRSAEPTHTHPEGAAGAVAVAVAAALAWRARTTPLAAADFIGAVAASTPPGRTRAGIERACWIAASEPGDRDTNAAIVGSIVVLAGGADSVPVLWRAATEPLPELPGTSPP